MSRAGKVITTRVGYKYRRASRWIKLHPYASGEDYFFRWHRLRIRLSNCQALAYPEFYDDEDGKTGFLSAYFPFCNTLAIILEHDYDGSGYIRVYLPVYDGGED